MKESIKKVLKIVAIICSILIIITVSIIGILKYIEYKKIQDSINTVYNIYTDNNRNEIITDFNNTVGTPVESETDEGQYLNAIGILEIPSISFKDIVVEGTDQSSLAQGIGLFEHSSILEGNVCLAGHNTYRFLANLKNVQKGDIIKYSSALGNKEYRITTIKQIQETDWSMLEDTEDNRITIITCVRNKPELRLCVQGIENI
mgnify:CR=1 FL=1